MINWQIFVHFWRATMCSSKITMRGMVEVFEKNYVLFRFILCTPDKQFTQEEYYEKSTKGTWVLGVVIILSCYSFRTFTNAPDDSKSLKPDEDLIKHCFRSNKKTEAVVRKSNVLQNRCSLKFCNIQRSGLVLESQSCSSEGLQLY